MLVMIFVWIPLCVAAGMFAHIRRNRSGFGWFLFAFFLSPFFAFLFCAILEKKDWRGFRREAIARGELPVRTVGDLGYDAVARELEGYQ